MPHPISDVLKAFAAGEIVVVTDDDDREGEGDLIVAASLCTAEKMAFIVRHTSGIVCAPITVEDARRLRLDPMVAHNDSNHSTAFTVSIDYKPGMTTGISAEERTACCRALANPNVGAGDFARPGHIFPLIARDGGVLLRSGHTEAAIDLCRLAGLPLVGVISELMNDDGTVMKGAQVAAFADKHQLKHVTIADMIAYRQAREKLIERVSSFTVDSPIGPLEGHAYRSPFDPIYHVAFVYGGIGDGRNVLTRFHKPNIVKDLFNGPRSVLAALEQFKARGSGVLVYLRDGAAGVPVEPLAEAASVEADRNRQWREVGVGAQILRDLGVTSIRNLTSSTHDYKGLSGFGIEIVCSEPLEG
ncbi:3,4-dihydroxy-2-butanone-4-phosphate synthase [Bradyrhizobium sp. U87765 SZCCT0131]|uniref:3,4-dihydroxy-2-butanone-4-phosphate synthase n=1 Tax=unclassified Bradyrhizobium TaxID=2631580 RepID=UPI001BAB2C5D|nr:MULTISPECIES: 3,4-dihydroxy-2-butanone-4-phosphate synthase [unclassified Bradyrhizobium]MBR1217923.1 3,4-dihydroxy-2-butanone-4-phosphate synthase [Bradyrhizobium sp. U87765 SZCCT0131]MBR1261131.1 3,4-dihydroxy-2-butanone-4-phosphate synthase [Bradyrhizobium sp. U87765 SZCCT0134]MBR1303421.1 3,4-dihydroxy-2-butanone-4-phosphate synthase [Bradyrhizobium sp. U87765 SZCCT0110]MBR1319027.1 3,4-dihydroxy-2-butanone-4-phosphate synthase [Bradyrhizobium sp. U87765 SZCCT0109]MBR1347352.1 3,4-dihyd